MSVSLHDGEEGSSPMLRAFEQARNTLPPLRPLSHPNLYAMIAWAQARIRACYEAEAAAIAAGARSLNPACDARALVEREQERRTLTAVLTQLGEHIPPDPKQGVTSATITNGLSRKRP